MEHHILFRSLRRLPCASLCCQMTFLFFTSLFYFTNCFASLCNAELTLKPIHSKTDYIVFLCTLSEGMLWIVATFERCKFFKCGDRIQASCRFQSFLYSFRDLYSEKRKLNLDKIEKIHHQLLTC